MKRLSVLLMGVALTAFGCSRGATNAGADKATESPNPISVETATAEIREVEKVISVTGSLHPDETVSVSSEVAGRVQSIRVDFGQTVRKGQVLAELDPREYLLQLERTQASLAQALARIGLTSGQEESRVDSTPAIRQAAAQLEDARFKYESAKKLVESGDFSQDRFNELEKAYRARQAALDAAQFELNTQLATIQALRAEVKLAQKRLNDATIRAPFDGSVSERLVSPGQFLKENTPLLTLVKTRPLRLRLEIPESAATAVKIGTTLQFTTDATAGKEFKAVVKELNPSLDPRSRSLTAEARLAEAESELRPGMFVQVRLVTDSKAPIVVVPKTAVYAIAGLTKVFLLRQNQAVECKIPPGLEQDGWIEVPGEVIPPGSQVATSNLSMLVDGSAIRAASRTGSAQTPPTS
ncbi:MAG: efflux RND transporter periplasmic adaptor subunit [Acidobacteriota bacterium]